MSVLITHPKVNNIAAWTQADLNVQIAAGNFPPGTLISDITLSTDWNSAHTTSMATSKLLGRATAGAGSFEEITLGSNLSFSGTTLNASAGTGAPGGADTNIQINDGGVFYGDANLVYTKANGRIGLGGVPAPTATISLAASTVLAGGIAFGTDANFYRSGVGILRSNAAILGDIGFYAPNNFGFNNSSSGNNAFFKVNTNGPMISRNIADANPSLIVQQVHASSTGDIVQFQNNAGTEVSISQDGTIVLGTNNLTMTGSIASTGSRVTKGWFTDLEVTNAIVGSITGNAATVTTNANLTGAVTSVGNATSLGSFSSANLRGALTDESGTGAAYFQGGDIGTPSAGVATNLTGTATGLTAGTATALATGRTISITGDVAYTSPSFDGSANVTAAGTVKNNLKLTSVGFTADGAGSAIAAGKVKGFFTCPYAATITGWNIVVDTGTVTVKVWKIATGTAKPTSSNSINTSGVSLSSGTAVHSNTVTDFTSTTVTANDIFAFNIEAGVSAVTEMTFNLELTRT